MNVSTESVPPPIPAALTQPCRLCKHAIPVGARLCSECGSYQNWLGSLNRSSLVLSLLVALASVLSIAIPAVKTALRPSRSDLRMVRYYFTDTGVSIVLNNKGAMPGFISSCKMELLLPDRSVWFLNFNLDQRSETRVVKGDSVAEVFFKTDHAWIERLLGKEVGPEWKDQLNNGELTQKLDVTLTQFDGSTEHTYGTVAPLKDFYYKY